jgi:hypothetical protein
LAILPVLSRHISKGEFNYNVDETQHAFTGVFVADLIHDHPIHHPVEYAYLYYVHYPALSGIIHWPPLFYVCEGVVFFLLGPSVVTARLTILLFAVLGLWFWFRLIEELHSTVAAVVATLLLAFCPSVLLFEKTVMLEIPALALCIMSSYFWIDFLRKERNSSLIWFALSGALAMLTKQNSVYLLLFCFFSISALQKWHLLWRRATLAALAIILCLAGPYYYVNYKIQWSTAAPDLLEKQTTGLQRLTYYWQAIPQLIGWPLLTLALVGVLTCLWWNHKEKNIVFLSWVFSVYLTMTLIGHKEARYIICLVPAVVYFATWPIMLPKAGQLWLRIPGLAALAGVMTFTAWSAWGYERPYVIGFSPVAREIRQIADSGVILVDTAIPANLVFFVRMQDPARRFVVLRKSLYSIRIKESLGSEEYIQTREELQELLRDDGIRFIVVSNRPPENFPIEVTLREMLETPQFRLVGQYPIEGNSPEWNHYYLSLYENLQWGPPTVPSLRIPMLTLGHDITVPFRELGITYAPHTSPSTDPARRVVH